jgi:hypothetical protein
MSTHGLRGHDAQRWVHCLVPCLACAVQVANSVCFCGHANTLCHSTLLQEGCVLLFVDASRIVRIRRTANLHTGLLWTSRTCYKPHPALYRSYVLNIGVGASAGGNPWPWDPGLHMTTPKCPPPQPVFCGGTLSSPSCMVTTARDGNPVLLNTYSYP